MAAVAQYSALAGKTRAMYGYMLKERDYRELMRRTNVGGLAEYLKTRTHYTQDLSDCDETNIHRGRLEKLLKRGLMRDYEKLAVFSQGSQRALVRAVFKKHEIESLKLLFRSFAAGHVTPETLEDSLLFLSKDARVNIPRLALSKDVSEFVRNLQGTEYFTCLRPWLVTGGEVPLFRIEMALDAYYYRTLARVLRRQLAGEDESIAKDLFGAEIDLYNLLLVYRCKLFYHMEPEVIQGYWVGNRHRISPENKAALLAASDRDELKVVVMRTPYGDVFRDGDERFLDVSAQEWLFRRHERLFRQKIFTIACMLSYLWIREVEQRNLVSLIECVRYRLPEMQLIRYLIGWQENFA